jgi:hypothetical protein
LQILRAWNMKASRFLTALLSALSIALSSALCLISALASAQDSASAGDFSLIDHFGISHQISQYADSAAVALLVQANFSDTDPIVIPAFNLMRQRLESQGIRFLMINPVGLRNAEAVAEEMQRLGSAIPVLMDDTQEISDALGIEVTGDVVLYDPRSFRVLFLGPIGPELEFALRAVIAGQPVQASTVKGRGNPIPYRLPE